jgi:hypothetical protein
MPKEFDLLRERLLRAGIGATQADRYVAELKDHLDDLRAEEQRAGWSPNDAAARAMRRLGYVDALAEAMIARREFRAWSARAPAAAYVVTPSVILAVATVLWLAALVGLCGWLRGHAAWGPADWPARIRPFADGAAWFSNTLLSILLGWGLAANAIRQRAPLTWPMLGLIVLAAVGAALQVGITLPAGGAPGEIDLGSGPGGSPFGLAGYWGRFAFNLAATATPFAVFHLWRERRHASPEH